MRCVSHPHAEASRQCSRCQRPWCPLCVKQLTAAGKLLELCVHCQGPLVAPTMRPPARPLDARELVARVFSADGLITAAAIAVPGALASLFGFGFGSLCSIAYWGSLIGYYFQIIAHVGDDGDGLPGASDALSNLPALLLMTLRGLLCVGLGLMPYCLWILFGGRAHTAWSLLPLAAGMTYLPAVLIAIVLTQSTAAAVYPVAWAQIMARAPRAYAQLVVIFVATVLAAGVILFFVSALVGGIPLVGLYLRCALWALLLFAQAALVGGFLRTHAEAFGYR